MTEDDGLIECRLCGKRCQSVGHHLRRSHGMSPDEYRERFGIPPGQTLTCPAARARWSASISHTITTGALDAHYSGNAARASNAASAGAAAIARRRALGLPPDRGAKPLPRARIVGIVRLVEQGTRAAIAVKRDGMSYSAYHEGLKRHPDLKARHDVARSLRRQTAETRGQHAGVKA